MIAYCDCYSGISGDMVLGALLDCGVDLDHLRTELAKLPLAGYELQAEKVVVGGLSGTRARVWLTTAGSHEHRHLSHILDLIRASELSPRVQETSTRLFDRLARAEASVHGCSPEEIHFHEVGAVDSIVDIVGCAVGLEMLGVGQVYCSPLPLGSGTVTCEHGVLPVPAPATLALCADANAPVQATQIEAELVTPTGAAIVCELARFERPVMRLSRIGYGFGMRELPWPNALRLWLGQSVVVESEADIVSVLETHVDDASPEILGAAMDALLAAGALDVGFQPMQMKKNRPGVRVTVVAEPGKASDLAALLLETTTSLGVRLYETRRMKCERWLESVGTPWGAVSVKVKSIAGRRSYAPEYEDCLRLANAAGVSLIEIYEGARAAAEAVSRR